MHNENEPGVAFADVPADAFPVSIEFIDRSGKVVWSDVILGPGALPIPALAKDHGPVGVRMIFASGEVVEEPAP